MPDKRYSPRQSGHLAGSLGALRGGIQHGDLRAVQDGDFALSCEEEDGSGCQRQLCRVPARAARVDDLNREVFKEAGSVPPLSYEKQGRAIDLSFWRAPERLLDEPDELVTWARAALAAARRVAAKRAR